MGAVGACRAGRPRLSLGWRVGGRSWGNWWGLNGRILQTDTSRGRCLYLSAESDEAQDH